MTGAIQKKQMLYSIHFYIPEMYLKKWQSQLGYNKTTGEKEPEDLIFTRQMAALYNKDAYDGKERVLEIHFTDLDHTYQIRLNKTGSQIFTDGSLSFQLLALIHLFLYGQLFLVEKLVAQRHWGNRCIRYPVISP